MITLTEAAREKLLEKGFNQAEPLRLLLAPRGCGAPKVTLEHAQPTLDDVVSSTGGFTVFMSPELHASVGAVTLDIIYGDFYAHTEFEYSVPGCGQCDAAATNGGQCSLSKGSTSCYN